MKKLVKFFGPTWRKALLALVLTAGVYAAVSDTPLNLNKPSEAATNQKPRLAAGTLKEIYQTRIDNSFYKTKLAVKAYDPDLPDIPKVIFKVRRYGSCDNVQVSSMISRSSDGYYYYTLTLTKGTRYEFSAKAYDTAHNLDSSGTTGTATFCGTTGWYAPAGSFSHTW